MPPFLTDDWLSELASRGGALPDFEGASIVCQHEIDGAPDGKVRFYAVWQSGRLAGVAKGKHVAPDCMIAAKAADALAVLRGDVELEVSFMQGRVKVDGDYRRLLVDLRSWRASDPLRSLCVAMAEITD